MKPVLKLLLISLFLLGLNVSVQADQSIDDEYLYTIHIGTFLKVKLADFEKVRGLGYLYAEKFDDQLMHIFMGEYESFGKAKKILSDVKSNGYPDAYVTSRKSKSDNKLTLIQLGVKKVGDDINWYSYARAGELYTIIDNEQLKILTGAFDNMESARSHLALLKQNGFKDAFVKKVPETRAHLASTFETGELGFVDFIRPLKEADKPQEFAQVDATPEKLTSKTVEERPTEYGMTKKKATPVLKKEALLIASPNIRKNVKRTSAIELQKELKLTGTYKGSLDGLYGNGTATAYQKALLEMPQLKRYRILVDRDAMSIPTQTTDKLQFAINSLLADTPNALKTLKGSNQAIAKAYQAYLLFREKGANQQVDDLMNQAIKAAYKGQKSTNSTKFDYNATYAYKDFGQLILHLRYIQGASKKEYAAPCWLFQEHTKEAVAAYEPNATMSSASYLIQDCHQQINWEELQLLRMIAADLNPDAKTTISDKDLALQTRLLMAPKPLNADDFKYIKNWNNELWKGLNDWSKSDPLHKKWVSPLKVTFFQSQVRLEDYFMDKGFDAKAASGLALMTLKTMVGHHLSSYMQ